MLAFSIRLHDSINVRLWNLALKQYSGAPAVMGGRERQEY